MMFLGFSPTIKFDLEFTGKELLQLLLASRYHYDWACQAASQHADAGGQKNGLIITTMMQSRDYPWGGADEDDAEWLRKHPDTKFKRTLSFRDLDLLCKISEQFSMMLKMPPGDDGFCADTATAIRMEMLRCIHRHRDHSKFLFEQEKARREAPDKPAVKLTPNQIAMVLETPVGKVHHIECEEVLAEREKIRESYETIKLTYGFAAASVAARGWWLQEYLKQHAAEGCLFL